MLTPTLRPLALVLLLCACFVFVIPAAAQDDPLTIGFAQVGSESAWRIAFTEATLAEAEARGINLLFSDADNSQETQIAALRSFIEQGVDAIILAPVVETGWDTVLTEVRDAGIPLVVVDRNVTSDPSLYISRVSSDFVQEGRLAAAWLAQQTSGECSIIELEGTVGSSAARDRQIGFNDVIALFPNMDIIFSQSGDFTREGGREVMEGIMLSEDMSDVCAIWAHNDDMMIGAVESLKAAGLNPGTDILTISVDAIPDIFGVMMAGDANATVELSPYMAAPAFDAIESYLAGETIPAWIPVSGSLYTQATAAEEYANRTR
ncbi:MAG: ABC transporter substrate-binding protein [Anaerolineae bacterium]|jgi:simple sugar transport system substrate-binding protein|nr:ABC transporter substrate-binding protein [Anaerolineae bacterium]